MRDSVFWRFIAALSVIGMFYVGHGLHRSDSREGQLPGWERSAYAAEPEQDQRILRWKNLVRQTPGLAFHHVYRLPVEGGWLVALSQGQVGNTVGGLTFVPDADHSWPFPFKREE